MNERWTQLQADVREHGHVFERQRRRVVGYDWPTMVLMSAITHRAAYAMRVFTHELRGRAFQAPGKPNLP